MPNGYNHGKLKETDLMAGDVVLVTGQYNKLGTYTVKAGEIIFLGYGQGDMATAIGRVFAQVANAAGTELKGMWEIQVESAQDIPQEVIGTWRSEDFSTVSGDKTKQLPWNFMEPGVSRDKKLVFYFKPDVADTAAKIKCVFSFDITRQLTNN